MYTSLECRASSSVSPDEALPLFVPLPAAVTSFILLAMPVNGISFCAAAFSCWSPRNSEKNTMFCVGWWWQDPLGREEGLATSTSMSSSSSNLLPTPVNGTLSLSLSPRSWSTPLTKSEKNTGLPVIRRHRLLGGEEDNEERMTTSASCNVLAAPVKGAYESNAPFSLPLTKSEKNKRRWEDRLGEEEEDDEGRGGDIYVHGFIILQSSRYPGGWCKLGIHESGDRDHPLLQSVWGTPESEPQSHGSEAKAKVKKGRTRNRRN